MKREVGKRTKQVKDPAGLNQHMEFNVRGHHPQVTTAVQEAPDPRQQ